MFSRNGDSPEMTVADLTAKLVFMPPDYRVENSAGEPPGVMIVTEGEKAPYVRVE
jgi:hypothetical protein